MRLIPPLLLAAVLAMPAVSAEGNQWWRVLTQEVERLYREGDHEAAAAVASKALEEVEAEQGANHPDVATCLNNLALVRSAQGEFEAAEPLYRRSVQILEKSLGPRHPDLATGLHNLGSLQKALRRFDEADALYRRALQIRERALGGNDPLTQATRAALLELRNRPGSHAAGR
ncbi:tetratricopeptide repeat protein [Chitinimonas lacunae]|uniref:Tetratricopeptide repeat protein n=1 Tax=Chitinimonas lacunae TaxID=1963018 RepID=A0ABV8MQ03_9NEIS